MIQFVRNSLTNNLMDRTLTIVTGDELKNFIDESVKSENYKTTSEVVREGLRLLQEKQAGSN